MADHLCRCRSKIRRGLLVDGIEEILDSMGKNNAYMELADWIPKYLVCQKYRLFTNLEMVQRNDLNRTRAT